MAIGPERYIATEHSDETIEIRLVSSDKVQRVTAVERPEPRAVARSTVQTGPDVRVRASACE